ncbi:MAG: hypothetical protein HDT14_11455 [Oscillibacter sp.]|nr:hypothetical protein [Oscillibacter sp.]
MPPLRGGIAFFLFQALPLPGRACFSWFAKKAEKENDAGDFASLRILMRFLRCDLTVFSIDSALQDAPDRCVCPQVPGLCITTRCGRCRIADSQRKLNRIAR